LRKFDEIVEFSEIEEFLDTPVKRYSSGMYVRLAFAVAAHLDPDILICDEVLSVGDLAFQKKCLTKIQSFAKSGKTVLFVSHNTETVRNLCQRVLWMKDGRLYQDGSTDDVLEVYSESMIRKLEDGSSSNQEDGLTIQKVVLKNSRGGTQSQFRPGEDLVVEISYDAQKCIKRPIFALRVMGSGGSCFASNMLLDGHTPEFLEGAGQLSCTFKSIPLLPQAYTITMGIRAANVRDLIIPFHEVAGFSVVGDLGDYGYKGQYMKHVSHSTPVVVPYEWRLPDGTRVPVALKRPAPQQVDSPDFSYKE
jgi:lipopolysaccharide transport system ATP-binding protein